MKKPLLTLLLVTLATPTLAQVGPGRGGYPGGGGGPGGRYGDEGGDPSQGGGALTRRAPERAMRPIPREVFDALVRAAFVEADLNHDGVVTLDEIRAAHEARRAAMINARFDAIDANHDGSISRDEFMAWQVHLGDPEMAHGARPDQGPPDAALRDNHDDHYMGTPPFGDRPDHGGHGPRGGEMVRFLIRPITANLVVEADTDHDGALSLAEDIADQDAIFAAVDSNHDGFLDEGELRAARAAREQR